ncbi:MAG TPA: hypothetical protein VFU22_25795 [Roseiflexaceae bacterium]|nr:hypothetical protein [Roseiflexaceae bacterium]
MAKAGLLFVGTDDGAVLFSNPNNIGRWLRIGQPFRGQAVRAIWPLSDNPLVVFAAVQGQGLQRSDDGGQSWRVALDGDIEGVVGHFSAASMLYAWGAAGELYASWDAGERWERCACGGLPGPGSALLAIAPDDARRLYLGQADGVWTSADAGSTWLAFGEQPPSGLVALNAFQGRSGVLYAVAAGELYSCDSAEGRWQRDEGAPPAASALASLAGQHPVLLLAQAGGIGRREDSGASWTSAELEGDWSGGISVIASVGYHIDIALAGSRGGQLAMSTDRGRTWPVLKRDLPPIRSVAAARLI